MAGTYLTAACFRQGSRFHERVSLKRADICLLQQIFQSRGKINRLCSSVSELHRGDGEVLPPIPTGVKPCSRF